ncbi:finTRIM family, member 86 [Electrophorus electricus]|uniref:finTRIM family, member 86 n=1 Tax=Electrophorus electricus TaxID=8005 RepID=UPI0015CFF07C|nr:finTRIM family, member 86 [Electrophorus electricus]
MAMSSCPPEIFSCSVCLEILCDPATLPCGHSYCLQCIQKHWDKAAKGVYSCPQCRQVFNPRPSLGRNNMLMEAMKKLSVREQDRPPSPVCSSMDPSPTVSTDSSSHFQQALPRGDGAQGTDEGGLYPQLPYSSPELCSLHHQLLELYCFDDKERVCDECSFLGHKGHRVVRPDEEKNEKQQELAQMKAMVQKCIHDRERIIQTLPQTFQAHKNAIQDLQRDSLGIYTEAMKCVESMNSHVTELLQNYESSYYNRIEDQRYRLQQEICQLYKQEEELNRMANTEDSIQFLNWFFSMAAAEQVGSAELQISQPEAEASRIRSAIGAFGEGLQVLFKGSLANIFRTVNDVAESAQTAQTSAASSVPGNPTVVSQKSAPASDKSDSKATGTALVTSTLHPPPPPANSVKESASFSVENPAPKTREEMLKFRFQPTLDHNSAYRHIRLSDGDRKATLRAENQNYPEHAERFLYWRQVICREPLAGSPYYWEVEWTGQKVTIGVAYKEMGRSTSDDSSRIGHNEHSWGLYWSGSAFSLWHAGKETALAAPKAHCIGIYLDQQAGVLAFYRVLHKEAHQICCVETEFSGPLFPSFRFWSAMGSTITLCQLD